ncbi:MAG: 23S rRNA (guanosine(2251)-2'-O)-methyltransferase RlmB [Gammaproteobacteria bacterium]|nr:23S rRNA (guanosine(2251)-2'-O)-methyltransferase RlmB [Gammaproteobacteria bacterium]
MSTSPLYGLHPIEALLTRDAKQIQSLVILEHNTNPRLQKVIGLAKKNNITIHVLPKDQFLAQLDKDAVHQGLLAYIQDTPSYQESDILTLFQQTTDPLFLILDGVQDPHNLGACLRSANAAGVTAVIAPKDNAVALTPTVRKVACGADQFTPFITVTNLARTLRQLKEAGLWLIGLEGSATQSLYDIDLKGPIGLILGSEGSGMRRLTKELCDFLIHIPMRGQVESLNVSNACAVSLFEVNRQRQDPAQR